MGSEVQVEHTTELQNKPILQEECSQLQCGDKYHLLWSVSSITSSSPHLEKSIPPYFSQRNWKLKTNKQQQQQRQQQQEINQPNKTPSNLTEVRIRIQVHFKLFSKISLGRLCQHLPFCIEMVWKFKWHEIILIMQPWKKEISKNSQPAIFAA